MLPLQNVTPSRRYSAWLYVVVALVGTASAAALVLLVYKAVLLVQAGRGLETYRTAWLVEFNSVGLLVLVVVLALVLPVGLFLRWLHNRRERALWHELTRKYGSHKAGV